MSKRIGSYPRVRVEGGGHGAVSQAGTVLLVETVRKVGLDTSISAALAPWRKPRTVHDPGKVLLDVALATALGGDCLADVAMLRAEPDVFGPVASDPTVSRLIDALTAIRTARAEVRTRVWELAGRNGPAADGSVIVDIDGVPVLTHSEKQDATATPEEDLRPSPARRIRRPRPSRLRRAGGCHAAARRLGRRDHRHARPEHVAEGDAADPQKGTPHPGAQLRFTDLDGLRLT